MREWIKTYFKRYFLIDKKLQLLLYRTQAVLDYQSALPSINKSKRLSKIKIKFDNVTEIGTIEIHKQLEQLTK